MVRTRALTGFTTSRAALAALTCLGLLGLPRPAAADEKGQTGRVVRVNVNTQASDKYASFHGSVTVRRSGSSKDDVYYWGGTTCPAQKVSDEQVDLLVQALRSRRTMLTPRYRGGEAGGTRCLVAFELVAT